MTCPRCRDIGQVIDFDGNVSECPEEDCLKQRAVEALGTQSPEYSGAHTFKVGQWKLSVAIKGFELEGEHTVKLTNHGSGYTSPPTLTFEELGIETKIHLPAAPEEGLIVTVKELK